MRGALVVALLLLGAGCKDKSKAHDTATGAGSAGSAGSPTTPQPVEHVETPESIAACKAAADKAAAAPLHARAQILIAGCSPCGDWTPLLAWRTPAPQGGPKRTDIEAAMERCKAYCNGDSKQKFLGTLDNARGTESRLPWRQLGEICKEQVSSSAPDARFASAPMFALDRIARAGYAAGLVVALPAVSIPGTGITLPAVKDTVVVDCDLQVTVFGTHNLPLYAGTLPRGTLGKDGVVVELGAGGYPGNVVQAGGLKAALQNVHKPGGCIALLAPAELPATALAATIAEASEVAPVHLAVRALESALPGWDVPGVLSTPLDAKLTAKMTVQNLATELAKRAPRL